MSLKDLDSSINLIYDNSKGSIEKELFVPLMQNAKKYYRGVGFFSSGWLKIALNGIEDIVKNNGKIYLITSPKISSKDYDAIMRGNDAQQDEILYKIIVEEMKLFLDDESKYLLTFLSWLIANDYVEIKFAICKNGIGMYHDKLAIFEDDESMVCVHGSINASLNATFNGEAVSVFKNWGIGKEYCEIHKNRFFEIWDNKSDFYKVLKVPKKLNESFCNLAKKYIKREIKNNKIIKIRDYQEKAMKSFIQNDWNGIYEMATGTGKTYTSIFTMKEYLKRFKKQFLIIIVPFVHLVPQWVKNLNSMGYENVLECRDSKELWNYKLLSTIRDYNSNFIENTCIITTYKTASTENFFNKIKMLKDNVCLIADECHYLGSKEYSKIMLNNIKIRLGLSATPNRWFDDDGTQLLMDYFKGVVYEYSLEEAILKNALTPYRYYPQVIHLDEEELAEYKSLTKRIANLFSNRNENDEYFQALCRKRKKILDKANNKYEKLLYLLKKQKNDNKLKHTLIYCSKGDSKKILELLKPLNINVHEFVYDVSERDRKIILEKFDKGEYDVLVAIKCLDEGVDVPSTKYAYFVSSSTNPREFVQRRGRILRKFKDKTEAIVYDFMVFPPEDNDDFELGKNIIKKELPRFAEFSLNSLNCMEAREQIYKYVERYNLEYWLFKKPYEVYLEYKEGEIDEKN